MKAIVLVALTLLSASPALAMSPECELLRRQIQDSGRPSQSAQYQAAAERQRSEIDRTVAYSDQIGCNNKRFLFLGSDPPPQCAGLRQQIARMRSNLAELQSHLGSGEGRGGLLARYNAECAGKPPSVLDALFGQPKSGDFQQQPLNPDGGTDAPADKPAPTGGEARAGGKAVCVRTCDGAFFPVSYSGGDLNTLTDICRALCPNAEVTLYTYPVSGEIEQAVSVSGARYMDSPTALRYRKVFDSSCSCRRRGQSWATALAPAENLLGKEQKTDIIVTPEKAAELSRPKADVKPDPKAKPGKIPLPDGGKTDVNGVDTVLRDAAAAISRDASGIGGSADAQSAGAIGEGQGKVIEEKGPDGAPRKVRVIGQSGAP